MNFQELLAKMQELDAPKTQIPVEIKSNEGNMPPAISQEPKDKASMSININAQGDAIGDILKLMKMVNPDMINQPEKPSVPTVSVIPSIGEDESVAELDDKQRTASSLKYSSDERVAYFDKMMKRYGPKLMELIIDYSHIVSGNDPKEEEKLKKYGKDYPDFMDHYRQMDGVEENFIDMLITAVDKGEEGLINFFYDRVEQAKKAGQFSKTSRLLDPDETHDEFDRKEREKDRKAQGESVAEAGEGSAEELAKEIWNNTPALHDEYKNWKEYMDSEDFEMDADKLRSKFEGNESEMKEGHYPHIKSFDKLYGIDDKQKYKDMADDAQSMDMGEFIDLYGATIDMAGDFWEDHQKVAEHSEGEMARLKELAGLQQEQDNKPIMINGKQVNVRSIEFYTEGGDGTDRDQIERAAEAYPDKAFFMDGTELSDAELEMLKKQYDNEMEELAYDVIVDQDNEWLDQGRKAEKEAAEAYANEPDEDERDINYITKKVAGGMNRPKGTHPKVAGADNPMQRVKEGDELRDSIKQQLLKALEETKGAK